MNYEEELMYLTNPNCSEFTCTFDGVKLPLIVTTLNRGILPEIDDTLVNYGNTNGSELVSSRFKERTIEMGFSLVVDGDDFGELRDKLSKVLYTNGELKKLVFSDQPDRFYWAKVTSKTSLEESYRVGTGSISWLIPDGVAYSLEEKEFIAVQDAVNHSKITINNEGTAPISIEYEMTMRSPVNFIQISGEGGLLKFGEYRDVGDGVVADELLVSTPHTNNLTTGTVLPYTQSKVIDGVLAEKTIGSTPVMYLQSVGVGSNDVWHGASKEFLIPDGSSTGAKDFIAYFNLTFETGLLGQTGCISIAFLDSSNNLMFEYLIEKADYTGNTAYCKMRVGGHIENTFKVIQFQPTVYQKDNPYDFNRGHGDVRKVGDTISGYWFGQRFSIVDPSLKDVGCKKVIMYIGQHGSRGIDDKFITNAFIKYFSFTRTHPNTLGFTPKTYNTGETLSYSGKNGMLFKNQSIPILGDKILGSSDFKVSPGVNVLDVNYTDVIFTPIYDDSDLVPCTNIDGEPILDPITGKPIMGIYSRDSVTNEILLDGNGRPIVLPVSFTRFDPLIKAKIREVYL